MTKRLNPKTQLPFSRGDVREDGYLFHRYTDKLRADGTFVEIWLRPETFKNAKQSAAEVSKRSYTRVSDRLPKGWKFAARNADDLRQLRRYYALCLKGRVTMEDLKFVFGRNQEIINLLAPLCKNGD